MGSTLVNTKIRNRQFYDRGIWDWEILRGCFGESRVTPTDIDGCIERRGNFLWIETKLPGIEIPRGQEIVLYQLARRGDTVLIVYGEQDKPEKIIKLTSLGSTVYEEADKEVLRKIVDDWWKWANGQTDKPLSWRVARLLLERFGENYCRAVASEWNRLNEKMDTA